MQTKNNKRAVETFIVAAGNAGLANSPTTELSTSGVTLGTAGAVTLSGDAVDAIAITNGGLNYPYPAVVTIAGDGTAAAATTTIDANGTIDAVVVGAGGSGYTAATATFGGPAGGAGRHINNPINGSVILKDKQIGIFADSSEGTVAHNTTTDATPTVTEAPIIRFYQGTEWSSNPAQFPGNTYPLWNEPYVASNAIDGRNSVLITYDAYAIPEHDVWVVGQPAGDAGEIVALDETTFKMSISYRGVVVDEYFSSESANAFNPFFVTPNYTDLGTAEPRDHLIQNLVWNINRNSAAVAANRTDFQGNDPIIALALDSTGAAGVAADTLTAGDFLPLVNTNLGIRGINLSAGHVKSIQDALAAAGFDAATGVLTVDLLTAGTATGGVADAFMIVALDRQVAYDDKVPHVKTYLTVGLKSGFDYNTTYYSRDNAGFEGQTARWINLWYKATFGQRRYNLDHTHDPVIEFPSPVDTSTTAGVYNTNYDMYIIEHATVTQIDTSNLMESLKKEVILLPTTDTTTKTELDTALNAWAASSNKVIFKS